MNNIDVGSNKLANFFQNSTDLKIKDISASRFFDIIGDNNRFSNRIFRFTTLNRRIT
jgi:hypothetical protein